MERIEFTSGDYTYILLEDGTAEIIDYDGQAEVLEIPSKLDGYTVTSISDEMCYDRSGVCSITIPDSVVSLGANPFMQCEELTNILVSPDHPVFETIDGVLFDKTEKKLICYPCSFTAESYDIPQGIRAIGAEAFYGCSALQCVTIPDSVISIGDYAFSFCNFLSTITIPTSVSSIGEGTFSHCNSLEYVTIPAGVSAIGAKAFHYCDYLRGVTISDGVRHIGDSAFDLCNSLTTVTLPNSVISLGANPFQLCEELTSIQVSPDHPVFETIDGVLFDKTEKKLICYPCSFTAESYAVPQGTRAIGAGAFYGCSDLRSVTLPDSMISIGDFAFLLCTSLSAITIPSSVSSIGESAFFWCSKTLCIAAGCNSYAAEYAKANSIACQ